MQTLRDLVDELVQAKVKAKLFGGDHAPQIGRLRLLDHLGAGAMGTVFAAYVTRLDRKVAVKVLRANGAARVLAEARALARLAHPNVVAVHDADELDGIVYIVMELAPGVPLRAWIAAPRGWRDIVRVLREAGTGIAAAHAAGLIHRDVKPDNILIGDDRARVVDFGLANERDRDDGTSAGTPFYMAPEVLGGASATAASDQFSFGVTMYEALYGKRPYEIAVETTADTVPADAYARGHAELLVELRDAAATASDAPRPPGTDVPAWLHAIVQRTLAAEPTARFGSVMDVVDALGRARRRRTRLVAIAAIGLVAGALVGGLAMRSGTSGNPCTGAAARTASAWNPAIRTKIEAALGGVAWSRATLTALDDHVDAWQTSYQRVCEATRVRGEQSDSLLDLRMRCLDRSLARLVALDDTFGSELDATGRAAAPGAIGELHHVGN
jgi:tRNA A-37 threonylcarbamoyl transferase component Bud32